MLINCIKKYSQGIGYEISLVTNATRDTPAYLTGKYSSSKISLIESSTENFNFSRMCNEGARNSKSEFILFLNDDVIALAPGWIDALLAPLQDRTVGAAGALLSYPDGRLQHAGMVLGMAEGAGHIGRGSTILDGEKFCFPFMSRTVSAVTGACLLTRRAIFKRLGQFDEKNFPIIYSDVDYCLKLKTHGLRCVYTPYAQLIHHEGASREGDFSPRLLEMTLLSARRFRWKWQDSLRKDPHLNPFIDRNSEKGENLFDT